MWTEDLKKETQKKLDEAYVRGLTEAIKMLTTYKEFYLMNIAEKDEAEKIEDSIKPC